MIPHDLQGGYCANVTDLLFNRNRARSKESQIAHKLNRLAGNISKRNFCQ